MSLLTGQITIGDIVELATFLLGIGVAWGALKVKIDKLDNNTIKSLDYLEESFNKFQSTQEKEINRICTDFKNLQTNIDIILKENKTDHNSEITKIKNDIETLNSKYELQHEKDLNKLTEQVTQLETNYNKNFNLINTRITTSFNKLKKLKEKNISMFYNIENIYKYELKSINKTIKKILKIIKE